MKWKKLAFIYGPIAFVFMLFLLVTMPLNTISSVYGFGVDSEGNVYVARNMNIDVYHGDERIDNIRLSNGEYSFTVLHEDTLVVAYTTNTYIMDKNGSVQKKLKKVHLIKIEHLKN